MTGHYTSHAWLTRHIARHNGIAAHLHHKTPEAFVDMVYQVLEAGPPRSQMLQPEQMVWLIDGILQDAAFQGLATAEVIQTYTADPVKRHTLALELARCYEHYQVAAPDMLRKWSSGERFTASADEPWQRLVWQAVWLHSGSALRSMHDMCGAIKSALKDPDKRAKLQQKVPKAYFFGRMDYTEAFLDLLEALSAHIDLQLFVSQLPSTHTDHPLLAFLGGAEADELEGLNRFNPTPFMEAPEGDPAPPTLLRRLQQELSGAAPGASFVRQPTDASLVIANCHSPFREVDALYHYLVRQFHLFPDLSPADVCVIVPNMGAYAPALKAVFSNPDYPIPMTLYAHSSSREASPFLALRALLDTTPNGLSASEIVHIMGFDAVRHRFGFPDDLSGLTYIIQRASIRQGYSGDKALDTHLVGWKHGLTRLLYGVCLPPGSDQRVHTAHTGDEFLPVTSFESTEDVALICRLYAWMERLQSWLAARSQERTLGDWVRFLDQDTMEVFVQLEDQHTKTWSRLLSEWAAAADIGMMSGRTFTFDAVRANLRRRMDDLYQAEKIGAGGVRVTQPTPYLSAPVRVYAMLGLQADAFPRQRAPNPLDILRDPVGGSAVGDDREAALDKQFFLQMLRTAQDACYLSYTGRSQEDNSTITSSPVLRALEETLNTIAPGADIQRLHPPSPLDKRYNRQDHSEHLYRYSKIRETNLLVQLEHQPAADVHAGTSIELNKLVLFLTSPIQYYYNHVLGVYLEESREPIQDAELFKLDGLQAWGLKDYLLKRHLSGHQNTNWAYKQVLDGKMPLKNLGEVVRQKLESEIELVFEQLKDLRDFQHERRDLTYTADGFTLSGSVDGIFGKELLGYYLGEKKSSLFKAKLRSNIAYLMLKNAGVEDVSLAFLSKNGKHVTLMSNPAWLKDEAWLRSMLERYLNKQHILIPALNFYVRSNTLIKNPELEKRLQQKLLGNYGHGNKYELHAYQNGLFRREDALNTIIEWHQSVFD